MSKDKFLKNLEGISCEFVDESWADTLFTQAEEVFLDYEEEIKELNEKLDDVEKEKDDLADELSESEQRINELEENEMFSLEGTPFNTLRYKLALDSLFENLAYIPIEELENLTQKHAVL